MSIIASAKTKAVKGNMKEAFKNEEGAIDLASIMVGIIVIGLVGGVIAATVFAVIPWAQDNAAKQQLDSISSAQSAYIGLSADAKAGGADQRFGGGAVTTVAPVAPATTPTYNYAVTKVVGNEASGVGVVEKLFDGGAAKVSIGYWGTGTGAHYAAAAKSASGKTFYITDTKTQPTLHSTNAVNAATAATNEAAAVANAAKAIV